jgi:uncharacterized protein YkwD
MLAVLTRRRKAGWIGFLLAASVVFSAVLAEPASAWSSPERALLWRHNTARQNQDIKGLILSASLSRKAESHSHQMAKKGYIYHSPCLSCRFEGYDWSVGGENVGVGANMRSLHRAFMDSAPHRRNVMHRSYKYVGIGAVRINGRLWVTVLFMG